MLRAHCQAWAWQDEWVGLTIEDIRRLERETQIELRRKLGRPVYSDEEEGGENGGGYDMGGEGVGRGGTYSLSMVLHEYTLLLHSHVLPASSTLCPPLFPAPTTLSPPSLFPAPTTLSPPSLFPAPTTLSPPLRPAPTTVSLPLLLHPLYILVSPQRMMRPLNTNYREWLAQVKTCLLRERCPLALPPIEHGGGATDLFVSHKSPSYPVLRGRAVMRNMGPLPASLALSGWVPTTQMKSTLMHMVCANTQYVCVCVCVCVYAHVCEYRLPLCEC